MIRSSPAIGMEVKILFFAAGKRRQKRLQRTALLFLFWKTLSAFRRLKGFSVGKKDCPKHSVAQFAFLSFYLALSTAQPFP